MRTQTQRNVGGSGRRYTAADRAAIFQGVTATMLAEIFRMKRQNVERRLANCPVSGSTTQGTPLYQIGEAAQFLVRVKLTDAQVRETLKTADPKDFPAFVNKMFWEGALTRRKYEELVNDLWHTGDVIAAASSAFNAIRMSLLLLPDELSDKAGLNEQQRTLVQDIVDAMLESCRDALDEDLRKPSRPGASVEVDDDAI